jgi:pSer/pThr/pTyr-binding forkhead associated (FHA) protein
MVMPAIRMPPAVPPPADAGTMVMQAVKAPPPVSADATVVFRPARLVPQNPEAGKTTFALAIKPMSIGSETSNDIRIGGAGIDARHAIIEPTAKGFVVRDLATKHGTRVNAEKITERVLVNEDVVQIGVARFVFRAG